jgi:uncharacterized protein YodC (DUF2158 family)
MNIGDVVRLKSGGPFMTVTYIDVLNNDELTCEWFEQNRGPCSKSKFPLAAVVSREELKAQAEKAQALADEKPHVKLWD